MTALAASLSSMTVTRGERSLIVSFGAKVRAVSWAIVGGGITLARHVAWFEVTNRELLPPVNPRKLLEERLRHHGLSDAVGLLTSRNVATYTDVRAEAQGIGARCIATVGLGNALRAGDPPGVAGRIGTINLLVHVDAPLSDEALLEASAIATEAKSAVVLEAGITSRVSGRSATGTGTDCTVVASPNAGGGNVYAGKHTCIGAAVGAAAERALRAGVARWLEENRS